MKLLWFAWLRAKVGVGEEQVSPPAEIITVGLLVDWLRDRSPHHAAALGDLSMIRVAVNQDYAKADHPIAPGDEIAFFPPVTGGCP